MQKTSPIGAQSIFGGFTRVPLLDTTFVIPQKLVCLRYPNQNIASRCLINILPDFLGLHICPCKASDKFIQLERVSLQGHFATYLYKNLAVIGRSVLNKKYQALSQQTLLLLLLILEPIFYELFKFYDLFWISTRTYTRQNIS